MLVLIVEDHKDTREMYATYLASRRALVETASNGTQAIAKATLVAPDAIVMDLGLPLLDGWEATRRLRASLHTSNVPILVLSAHADAASQRQAMDAGATMFLTKPCAPAALWEALLVACKRRYRPGATGRSGVPKGVPRGLRRPPSRRA
jgi:CheY-like chemotaxis protein